MTPREELLARLARLHVARSAGQRKPHKPLLFLCALQRLIARGERDFRFVDVARQIEPLLRHYAPPVKSSHSPELPYWHLQGDGVWEVPQAEQLKRSASGFPRMSALRYSYGRIPERFSKALLADPELVERAIQLLLDNHFEPSLHEDLRAAIGIEPGRARPAYQDPLEFVAEAHASHEFSVRARPRSFREEVLAAYDQRCAVTGYQALLAGSAFCLEAAHVRWHSQGGPSSVDNGLALTPTLHKLFDHGAWSIDDQRRVVVSRHFSGSDNAITELRALHGRPLRTPAPGFPQVALENVRWHRDSRLGGVFRSPALEAH